MGRTDYQECKDPNESPTGVPTLTYAFRELLAWGGEGSEWLQLKLLEGGKGGYKS